jgi:hypothetical protein
MATFDFTDFYVLYRGHPRYNPQEINESELVNVIVQKYEVMLFTNQGEVLGNPDFGANLLDLLYQTGVSGEFVRNRINEQIQKYIPELYQISYNLNVVFAQDPEKFQDIMFVNLRFADIDIYAQFGRFT